MSYAEPKYPGGNGKIRAVPRRAGQPNNQEYFESLAEWALTSHRPSAEERAEFMLRHDTYWL
jgi:hypothetical protein